MFLRTLVFFICIFCFHTINVGIFGHSVMSDQQFICHNYKNKEFHGRHIAVINRRSAMECANTCAVKTGCQLANFQLLGQGTGRCELIGNDCSEPNKFSKEGTQALEIKRLYSQCPCTEKACPKHQGPKQTIPCSNMYSSCEQALDQNCNQNGQYKITFNPSGIIYMITCHWNGSHKVTVFDHDTEWEVYINGGEDPGSVKRAVSYTVSDQAIAAVIDSSSICRQYVYIRCHHAILTQYAWLTGRNGKRLSYMAGGDRNHQGCSCGRNGTCKIHTQKCNCDSNYGIELKDEGYILEKEDLPITAGFFGDVSGTEYIYFRVGKLECFQ